MTTSMAENKYFLWCISFYDIAENNHGGAIYLSRGSVNLSVFEDEFFWCRLTDKSFTGGAIYADVKSLSITYSSFERCYAFDQGAAFYIDAKTERITTSHISVCNIESKEQEVWQDVCQLCSTTSNTNNNGNLSKCSVTNGFIFTLYPSSGIEASISYFNFEQMFAPYDLDCAVHWAGFCACFRYCNFLKSYGYLLFRFGNNPTVKFSDCTFSDVFVSTNNVGQSLLSYSNIYVENTTLASLLRVPEPIKSGRTIEIVIRSRRECECTRGIGRWNENENWKGDHLITYLATPVLSTLLPSDPRFIVSRWSSPKDSSNFHSNLLSKRRFYSLFDT